jgi:two-component sensor histidine kinase
MDDIGKYCQEYTDLSAMQYGILKRVSKCLSFVSDLAQAQIGLYVQTKQAGRLLVLADVKPHTVVASVPLQAAGTLTAALEEPLVIYTFQNGEGVKGKREWTFGNTIDMWTFPIKDGQRTIAVVSLETTNEVPDSYEHVLHAVQLLLSYARRTNEDAKFRPVHSTDGIIMADRYNRIVYANMAAVQIYRTLGIGSLVGCRLFDRQFTMYVTSETVVRERPWEKEQEVGGHILQQRDLRLTEGGQLLWRIFIVSDVTELRQKEKEIHIKSAIIQEIHHRVKNNLQTIASLLRMQARRSESQEVKAALQESMNRIMSISVVHAFLSRHDTENIDVIAVAQDVIDLLEKNMLPSGFRLEKKIEGPHIVLPVQVANNFGLVVNELVLNAIEHGFADRDEGLIGFRAAETASDYQIDIYNDGQLLPAAFDLGKCHSLGLQIVRTLVTEEMGGRFELYSGNMTHAKIILGKQREVSR